MSGIAGLGRRAVAGRQDPEAAALSAALDRVGLHVNRDNVLAGRAVLLQEAGELRDLIAEHKFNLDVGLCGGDPVSPEFRAGFAECVEILLARIRARIEALTHSSATLAQVAREYGHTEAEIAASFRYVPPTVAR